MGNVKCLYCVDIKSLMLIYSGSIAICFSKHIVPDMYRGRFRKPERLASIAVQGALQESFNKQLTRCLKFPQCSSCVLSLAAISL
jgi:hypothetical protein